MSRVTLTPLQAPALRIDARSLQPLALSALDAAAIAALPLQHGNESLSVGDLFFVNVEASDEAQLIIDGDASRFDAIGWGMDGGTLTINGNAGHYLGAQMRSGTIQIAGDAGKLAACEMAGGKLAIAGNVGDLAASALPGNLDGMRGGILSVGGHAGDRFGDRMRRGTALVFGNAGDYLASRMVAGTIAVAGSVGAHACYGMQRGTVILCSATPALGPSFVSTEHNVSVIWALLSRDLAKSGGVFAALPGRQPRRQVGDLAANGKGEVFSF
jgi:formylmethanofuran dehydrogenase subunit C